MFYLQDKFENVFPEERTSCLNLLLHCFNLLLFLYVTIEFCWLRKKHLFIKYQILSQVIWNISSRKNNYLLHQQRRYILCLKISNLLNFMFFTLPENNLLQILIRRIHIIWKILFKFICFSNCHIFCSLVSNCLKNHVLEHFGKSVKENI